MKLMKQLSARAEMQIRSIELCLLSQFDLCSAIGLVALLRMRRNVMCCRDDGLLAHFDLCQETFSRDSSRKVLKKSHFHQGGYFTPGQEFADGMPFRLRFDDLDVRVRQPDFFEEIAVAVLFEHGEAGA